MKAWALPCTPTFFILLICLSFAAPGRAATWTLNGPLNDARYAHSATLLATGKILIAGGLLTNGVATATAELYDPISGACTLTASMATNRSRHTATLLPNGKVLVAGGALGFSVLSACEIYDPVAGTWTNTGSLNVGRFDHTATLLANGKVLVVGGGTTATTAAAELYDYTTGLWATAAPMTTARTLHCATLLTNGQVLVTGGQQGTIPVTILSSAEVYDPLSNVWHAVNSMISARVSHTAVMLPSGNTALAGKVLVAGGGNSSVLSACELYNPSTGTWGTTVAMHTARQGQTASVLPNGDVLVTGGQSAGGTITNTSEIYIVTGASASWATPVSMNTPRMNQTATLLPSGKVIVIGGEAPNVTPDSTTESFYNGGGDWNNGGTTVEHAAGQEATLLPSGKVLVTGGFDSGGVNGTMNADLYDPSTGTWEPTSPMTHSHVYHSSTLLQNGNVLVTGDDENDFSSEAEVYNTALGTWTDIGPGEQFALYSATLLLNGKVLLAGGVEGPDFEATVTNACFLYDPVSQTFSQTGFLNTPRYLHSATLLTNGQVLVAGGVEYDGENELFFAGQDSELYDPNTGHWSYTAGSMTSPREYQEAVLLPNGQVLAIGGFNNGGVNSSAEIFNPNTGLWSATGSMNTARADCAAALLPGGMVLAASGASNTTNNQTTSVELYDPGTGAWTGISSINQARFVPSSVVLPSGQVFVCGGYPTSTGGPIFPELFSAFSSISATRVPQITSSNAIVYSGGSLTLNGTLFRDLTGGSGGNNAANSPTDYPVVQLRNIQTTQTIFLPPASWGSNVFVSMAITNFPAGYALATVFVNGITGASEIVQVSASAGPVPIILTNLVLLTNGTFQFSFTNTHGVSFRTFVSTNAAMPLSNWSFLGNPTEVSSGHYQFDDAQATNTSRRFYRVESP